MNKFLKGSFVKGKMLILWVTLFWYHFLFYINNITLLFVFLCFVGIKLQTNKLLLLCNSVVIKLLSASNITTFIAQTPYKIDFVIFTQLVSLFSEAPTYVIFNVYFLLASKLIDGFFLANYLRNKVQ